MSTTVIPLRELQADAERLLTRCADSGDAMIVELPDRRRVRIEPVEGDDLIDNLIEHNAEFRDLLARSAAGPFHPFPPPEPADGPGDGEKAKGTSGRE